MFYFGTRLRTTHACSAHLLFLLKHLFRVKCCSLMSCPPSCLSSQALCTLFCIACVGYPFSCDCGVRYHDHASYVFGPSFDYQCQLELVLFDDALRHLLRLNRLIEMPRGSALLVGVGGSGKQSLTRLASYISRALCFQITLTKTYSVNSFMEDLRYGVPFCRLMN